MLVEVAAIVFLEVKAVVLLGVQVYNVVVVVLEVLAVEVAVD